MTGKGRLPQLGPVNFPTLGFQIVDWWETFLRHGPGDVIGERWLPGDEPGLALDDEEIRHLCWCYRLNGHGRRVFHRVVRVAPKGRRKSEIAGGLVVVEAIGPCRFSHWAAAGEVSWWGYPYREGEPVGRPLLTPFIRALATEEDQTGNTYDNTYEMLRGPEVRETWPGLDVGLTRTNLPAGGEITPSTSGADSKEGGKESFGVADETYLWRTKKHRDQHRMVTRNLAKRKAAEGWMYETSNAHKPGQGSVLERAYEYALRLGSLEAMVRAGVLIDWREPTDPLVGKDFGDDRKVRRAIRDVYGPASAWLDVVRILTDIRDPETEESDARRAWLNQVAQGTGSWLDLARWRALETSERLEPGTPVAAGFDGSRFDDSTGIIVVTEDGLIVPWRWWEKPADAGDDWEVDEAEVDGGVDELFQTHPVARFYGDPFYWTADMARWARDHGPAVRTWKTNEQRKMALALDAFEVDVRAAQGADPTVARLRHASAKTPLTTHVGNAHTIEVPVVLDDKGRLGHILSKERKGSPHKIDLAMAMVLGWTARTDALAKNEFRSARIRGRKARLGFIR
ncbi:Phage terminase large subunit [Patulibacter medicamentivorans]|uniref:Phage terminase large subunit n=1 Tax=Patulibacter medicamentivorans TaxID=1097667 RepID=H0EA70_9ACTN|nr:hypothetical protein [Patulibacter medicamentivorans]EHN09410.1 Phage terminase large subunit [Patulibacter medicamentivorans]